MKTKYILVGEWKPVIKLIHFFINTGIAVNNSVLIDYQILPYSFLLLIQINLHQI